MGPNRPVWPEIAGRRSQALFGVGRHRRSPRRAESDARPKSSLAKGVARVFGKGVDTENPVRIENAGFRSVCEIIIVSTMTPFFIALLALVTSTFRTRAAQQAEIVAL